jgi:hypothetical protein
MSGSSLQPIQTAIYDRLTTDLSLMDKITGVYDDVDQDIQFPYVTIGDSTSIPWRTQTRFGEEVTVTLHIWSRYQGYREAYEILDDLNRLLADKDLNVDGYDAVAVYYEFMESFRDPDGQTRHVVVRYRLQVQELSAEGSAFLTHAQPTVTNSEGG